MKKYTHNGKEVQIVGEHDGNKIVTSNNKYYYAIATDQLKEVPATAREWDMHVSPDGRLLDSKWSNTTPIRVREILPEPTIEPTIEQGNNFPPTLPEGCTAPEKGWIYAGKRIAANCDFDSETISMFMVDGTWSKNAVGNQDYHYAIKINSPIHRSQRWFDEQASKS